MNNTSYYILNTVYRYIHIDYNPPIKSTVKIIILTEISTSYVTEVAIRDLTEG